ncbi:CDP-diacylglycerol--serine O-phosphatidyltransferase [Bacillus testis]|uniref:CDP-diacylglycerol--serine O-phosphatidyltransferase n=1 Tax=Bacillus testis TaxID=1622072 RepID=UPI00067F140E|nr:CDP-diacylglycerol--serine O-phosphatidyltransferase [Bacillus testis]
MKKQIPNLLTLGNLFCGFLSLYFSMNGDLKNATILIFISIMLDAVDGRAARILGVANDLGKQLDSLADIVSFGVAPAYIAAQTFLGGMGVWGVVLSSLFPLFGAYRLARFNLTKTEESLEYFTGIPITMAGGIVTFIALFHHYIPTALFLVIFYALGLLMVSTIKIPSLKDVKLPKNGIITTIFMICMIFYFWKTDFKDASIFFYLAILLYIGFITTRFIKEKEPLRQKTKGKKRKKAARNK